MCFEVGIVDIIWIYQIEIADIPIFRYLNDINFIFKGIKIPIIRINKILNFIWFGRIYNWVGIDIQEKTAPLVIDNGAMIIKGISIRFFEVVVESFFVLKIIVNVSFIVRIEYVAVTPIEEIIKIDKICINLDFIIISIIISFEKNPDINGSPIKASIAIPITEVMIGEFFIILPMCRISWYDEFIIIIPAVINIMDLNKAWVIRWKNARFVFLKEIANIIIAICLKVEKAIIFFISCSQQAVKLA